MEVQSGVTQSIIDQLHCSGIQRDQMESVSGVAPSIIDQRQS